MPNIHALAGADRVRQQTTTTGTGTLSLGTVPIGARGFVAAGLAGKTVRAVLTAANGTDWQIFDGVVTDGDPDTLTRATTYLNHLGTTANIDLAAGTHTVEISWGADLAALSVPRLLTNGNGITLAGGVLTIDCMGAADVIARVTLSANVDDIVLQNTPERCTVYFEFRQSGGPWTVLQSVWPDGTVFDSYNIFSDSTVSRVWWVTTNGGTDALAECNTPTSGLTTADVDDTPVDGAITAPVSSNWAFDHAALATAHGITAAAATVLDDATVSAMVDTLGGAASTGTGGLVRATAPTLAALTLSGTLNGGAQEIGRHLNRVVTSVTGALSAADHSGCVLKTSGNVTVPTTAGFNAVIIAGGAHTVTFNGTVSAAMATGDVMTVFVESSTIIHAVLTAAANKVTFS